MISRISYEELQDMKNTLKGFQCTHCESDKLEIPEDRIRSFTPPFHGEPSFKGLAIVCKNCNNKSHYDLERNCFGDGVIPLS